jgi:hypothetical protein
MTHVKEKNQRIYLFEKILHQIALCGKLTMAKIYVTREFLVYKNYGKESFESMWRKII